jgi:cation-transporting P-type ATPase D
VVSVRWAAVALTLYLAGLTAQLNGASETVWWTLYLACYLTGGWGSA